MVADTRTTAPTSVLAQAEALDGGEIIEIRCDYLVGCEGGRSETRRVIGAKLHGDTEIGRVQSTFIRASSLLSSLKAKPAWGTFSLNARRSGNVYAIDGRATWLVHNYLRPDEHDFDAVDRDASLRAILGVGADFNYEVISKEDWIARRLVADRFRDRRAFICSSLTIWTEKTLKARSATARTATAGSGPEFEAASEKPIKTTFCFELARARLKLSSKREGRRIDPVSKKRSADPAVGAWHRPTHYANDGASVTRYGLIFPTFRDALLRRSQKQSRP
jgi:hypothetical protein